MKLNNPDFEVKNPNSYHYPDVITHIPVQRSNHQCASYTYRANQMVKHAFEDGHMNQPELQQHTSQMNQMPDKEAFHYARQHLNFK